MLNILFVIYYDFGNSAIQVHNFANALTERGHECVVAVPENTATNRQHIGETMLYTLLTYAETLSLTCVFSNGKPPDIIHAWTPREPVRRHVLLLIKRFSSSKVVVHLEDNEEYLVEKHTGVPIKELRLLSDAHLRKINFNHLSHPKLYKTFLESADGITVIMDRLLEFAPENHTHLLLWPIIDTEKFNYKDKDRALKKSLGILDHEFVITYTGNVHVANAHEMRSLYLAIALANREGIPTRLVRTGKDHYDFLGEQTAWAHQYSIELGLVAAEKVPYLLSLSDVLIQPGKADCFNDYRLPAKLPEFLATGKPVALPDSNLGHLLHDREEAIILKKGDGLEIFEVIKEIRNNPELAKRISKGGRKFAVKHFSKKNIGKKLEDFYVQIAQQRPASKISSDMQPFFERYKTYEVPELSYTTVRDYCDSRDHLAALSQHGDLKNVQRPWAVKAIVSKVPQGGKLLEIGAGEPVVANFLYKLGYDVTVVDPYDGSGYGPTEYDLYKQQYPHLKIIRQHFDATISGLSSSSMDCIYSISVLEHIPDENIHQLFETIAKYLQPNGVTLHAIDHVLMGEGDKFHEQKLQLILQELNLELKFDEVIEKVKNDIDTYFLSAESYYWWKGTKTPEEYPFRKVTSINICKYPHKKTQQTQQQLRISSSPNESEGDIRFAGTEQTNPNGRKTVTVDVSARVDEHWSNFYKNQWSQKLRWWQCNRIVRRINKKVSGKSLDGLSMGLFELVRERYAGRRRFFGGVSVGCGQGTKEFDLMQHVPVENFELYELSKYAVQSGSQMASDRGLGQRVRFHLADAFQVEKLDDKYDILMWNNALHHMSNVDDAIAWSRRVLKPGGLFVMDEFVGPTRMQYAQWVLDFNSELRRRTPKKYLQNPVSPRESLPTMIQSLDPKAMFRHDPSECADSGRILECLTRYFPNAEVIPTGGAAYHLGLNDVLHNILEAEDWDELERWLNADDELIARGETHYAVALAEKAPIAIPTS